MSIKIQKAIGEGFYIADIKGVHVKECKNGMQMLIFNLVSNNKQGSAILFTNNTCLIEKLMKITYEDYDPEDDYDDEVDEKDFIGIRMKVKLKEKNGYLNIVDIIDLNPCSN